MTETDKTPDQESKDKTPDQESTEKTFPEAYVKQIRDEAAKARTEKNELAKRLEALENEKLSEQERKDKEFKATQEQLQTVTREKRIMEVQLEAINHGAKYPDVVAKMIDPDTENVIEAIESLKTKYADMFGKVTNNKVDIDAGKGGEIKSEDDINSLLRRKAGRKV